MSESNKSSAQAASKQSAILHSPQLESLLSKLRPFQREAFDFAVHGISCTNKSARKKAAANLGKINHRQYGKSYQVSQSEEENDHASMAGAGTGRILLGDEMGLGKTLSSLAIMLAYQQTEWPLLILCPASLRYTWPAEIEKFCPSINSSSIHVVRGKDDVEFAVKIQEWRNGCESIMQYRDSEKINPTNDPSTQCSQSANTTQKKPPIQIVIVTYSLLQSRFQVANLLQSCHFHCVIADESHNLKQMSSQRCQLALPLLQSSKRLVLLSGTPALNRPVELWPQLVALDPAGKLFGRYGMKYNDFTRRYCNAKNTRFGWDVKGVSNADELHSCLKKVMVRRLKSEVLQDLPAKQRSMIHIAVHKEREKECREIMSQLSTARQSLAEILDDACDEEANSARFESRRLLMEAYRVSGIAKAPSTTEYILDWLDGSGTQKLIVFAHHKDVLDYMETTIKAKYKGKLGMMRIDGSVPPAERALFVKKFQSNASMRLALLSMTAAGVGLTLTAASSIIFAELHWVPGVLAQAEDRCHRISQENSVHVMYCICKDADVSVDMSLWAMLGRKVGTLGRVVDGQRGNGMDAKEVGCVTTKQSGVSAEEELANFFASNSTTSLQSKLVCPPVKGTIQSFFSKQANKTKSTDSSVAHTTTKPINMVNKRKEIQTFSLLDDNDDSPRKSENNTATTLKDDLLFLPFTCQACTYENQGGSLCEICGTARLSETSKTIQPRHEPEMVKLHANDDDDEWACNTCTLLNKSSHLSCSACGQERHDVPSCVSQSPSSLTDLMGSDGVDSAAHPNILSFSVSNNSGRIALHQGNGQPLHVNFDISQVLTEKCTNQLEEAVLLRSLPGKKKRVVLRQIEFDDRGVVQVIKSINALGKKNLDAMSQELKKFVSCYLELREIEKKALKESGVAVSSSLLKSTAANLVVSTVSGETKRYTGGAKEMANLNVRNSCASKRDLDIIKGKACSWCGELLQLKQKSSNIVDATYCSYKCAEEGRIRRGGIYSSARIRSQLFSLEHGVCCLCGLNANALYQRILSLHPAERMNALLNAKFKLPKSSTALKRLLHDPKEPDFWQADHVVAVAEGGGGCGIDNLRTLCTTCHLNETEKLRSRLKSSQINMNRGQTDILSAFSGSIAQNKFVDGVKKRKRRTAD